MMLALMPVLCLVLADRASSYAEHALWPLTMYAVGSVLFWAWTESRGAGDLWPYIVVRFGGVLLIATLLWRSGMYSNSKWIVAAIAMQLPVTAFELFDVKIWHATGQIASGHNLKHVAVAVSMACVFGWLRYRTTRYSHLT